MTRYSQIPFGVFIMAALASVASANDTTVKDGETIVTYDGISERYAKAIAKTVESARAIAKDKRFDGSFYLDFPFDFLGVGSVFCLLRPELSLASSSYWVRKRR